MPSLREFHARYHEWGFEVVGMFHNSDSSTLEDVRVAVEAHGFPFPVAVDRHTKTRRRWSLGRDDYGLTSVSFLLDRQGVIRYIHPGGQYVQGDAEYASIESRIENLLFADDFDR